ncbi:insulinase family protein [Clostridium sp. DL1XJH146]
MEYKLNSTYSGFKLIEQKDVKELNSKYRLFIHEKTGAKLLNFQNDDDNKVFAIGFRTPPHDNTGVAHILEHSVLCGSRKFPGKDPFVELAKGSLNTFLNAMTYSDKTLYPVASRNEKDFFNLMDVYMDAVLYPNIYKYPQILMQEGWHYEIEDEKDPLTYKGVVYNEMLGVFSSPEDVLFRKIQGSLFPDTTYGYESGGDPDYITDLTYEDFLTFHKKYYHPSNSYIYLYGDGELDKRLKFLNDEYLSKFDMVNIESKIETQKEFSEIKEVVEEYPVSPKDDGGEKSFLSLNYVLGDNSNDEIYLAFNILEYILLETPAAPLKKALIDAKLGKDVFGYFDSGIKQSVFSIIVKGAKEGDKERFKKVVYDELKKIKENGLDKKLIEAGINAKEFVLREGDTRSYPKGLLYFSKAMDSMLYDNHPLIHIEYEKTLEKIKKAFTTSYFEDMIDKYLLNNKFASMVILNPKKGLAEEKKEILNKKLDNYKKTLSEEEIKKLVSNTKELKERQQEEDSKEDKNKIPLLSKQDINSNAEKLILEKKEFDNIPILFREEFTNKIVYIRFIFDLDVIKQDLIPYIGLLSSLIGKVDTEKYNYMDLANEINISTGGIGYYPSTFVKQGDCDTYNPKFLVKSKVLVNKVSNLLELLNQILNNSKFDDKKRIKEIIQEAKSRMEMSLYDSGHMVAANRVFSYFSEGSKYDEILSGLSFYDFVVEIDNNFEDKWEEVKNNLELIYKQIFNKNNIAITFSCEKDEYEEVEKQLPILINNLNDDKLDHNKYKFELKADNEGLLTQANVQYVAKGYNFIKLGYEYSGRLSVLKSIVTLDYLWNKVRVLGGAYGAFVSFSKTGNVVFVSYRDPNLKETLDNYDKLVDYLNNFKADEKEITKYIIGTISGLDSPLTPSMKLDREVSYYMADITSEDLQRERDEILSTKDEDIRGFSNMIKDVVAQNNICVLGNEEKIRENEEVFNNLIDVFN